MHVINLPSHYPFLGGKKLFLQLSEDNHLIIKQLNLYCAIAYDQQFDRGTSFAISYNIKTLKNIIEPIRNGCPRIPTNFDVKVQYVDDTVAIPPSPDPLFRITEYSYISCIKCPGVILSLVNKK